MVAALLATACLGRGNTNSTSSAENRGTVAAAARSANTPVSAGSCRGGITPEAATQRLNQEVTVIGPVVATGQDTNGQDTPTYLEMGAPFPDPKSLSIVILGANRNKFPAPPETLYKGKTICVVGVVQDYRQRKAIIVGTAEGITTVATGPSPVATP